MNLSDMENTHVYYLSLHKSFSVLKNQSLFYPISEMNLLIARYLPTLVLFKNQPVKYNSSSWLNQILHDTIPGSIQANISLKKYSKQFFEVTFYKKDILKI